MVVGPAHFDVPSGIINGTIFGWSARRRSSKSCAERRRTRGSAIFEKCVRSTLARHGSRGPVTWFSRRPGLATRASISRKTRVKRRRIRSGRCFRQSTGWQRGEMNNDHYTYRVTWSPDDGEHVGLCSEFPSLSWLARSPETALKGIRKLVVEVIAEMEASGETIPEPLAERQYSGQFRVRIPPQLHRALAMEAAEQRVSLNRLASAKLAA